MVKSVKKVVKKSSVVSSKSLVKGSFLARRYKEAKSYLIDSKKHINMMIGIFVFFALLGFFIPLPEEISMQLLAYFQQLVEQTKDYGALKMMGFLFQNNVGASFMGLAGGLFFGIFPLFNGIMNGFVLGFASSLSVTESGIISLWRLFPHGIFELPALFISLGIGLRLGGKFVEKYFKIKNIYGQVFFIFGFGVVFFLLMASLYLLIGKFLIVVAFLVFFAAFFLFMKDNALRREFQMAIRTFFYIVIPLLIAAAIIEGGLIVLG
ncbi:MAG: stage II sporulation protein M [Nanoarchaeota archaeon]|jgi:stage II sporulation protein M|nr:stage II sporulation protein M [Nanoarchaeota archaeon]